MTWFEEYTCGCISDWVERRKDLLGYCATHGSDRRNVYGQRVIKVVPLSVAQIVRQRLEGLEYRQQARDARRARRLAQKKAGKRPAVIQERLFEEAV